MMESNSPKSYQVEPFGLAHCVDAARLHIEGIPTGFISSLGLGFVTALYEAIAEDSGSFGVVATEKGHVIGFVAFTVNLSRLYKQVILKKGLKCAFVLAHRMFSMKTLRKIRQNLFYPSKMKKLDLPDAELLSVVVAAEGRGRGTARRLIEAGLEECRTRGIDCVKVLVADFNETANRLYQKTGFEFVCQVDSHGVTSNIYVSRIDPDENQQ